MPDIKYRNENLRNSIPFNAYVMGGEKTFFYHWHEQIELLYCVSGFFKVGIGNEIYTVEKGQCVLIAAGQRHCIFSSDDTHRRVVVLFDPELAQIPLLPGEGKTAMRREVKPHSAHWPEQTAEKMRACILTLLKENQEKNPGWAEAVCAQLFEIKCLYIRELPAEKSGEKAAVHVPAMKKVLGYLGENFRREITLNSCAAELGYNRSYLSALMKKNTGSSFHSYLTNIRLSEACQLLANREISVADAGRQSGFSSLKTFHRVFYARYSMSPGAYRKKYASPEEG